MTLAPDLYNVPLPRLPAAIEPLTIVGSSPADDFYGELDEATATFARDTAASVRLALNAHQRHKRESVRSAIAVGVSLNKVKAKLGHGRFGDWIAAEFDMSDRTARRYMSAATAFGSKLDTVSDLPLSAIYKLADDKLAALRSEIIRELEAGKTFDLEDVEARIAGVTGSKPAPAPAARTSAKRKGKSAAAAQAHEEACKMIVHLAGFELGKLIGLMRKGGSIRAEDLESYHSAS